jgi:hypothetical protein
MRWPGLAQLAASEPSLQLASGLPLSAGEAVGGVIFVGEPQLAQLGLCPALLEAHGNGFPSLWVTRFGTLAELK